MTSSVRNPCASPQVKEVEERLQVEATGPTILAGFRISTCFKVPGSILALLTSITLSHFGEDISILQHSRGQYYLYLYVLSVFSLFMSILLFVL